MIMIDNDSMIDGGGGSGDVGRKYPPSWIGVYEGQRWLEIPKIVQEGN